MSFLGNERKNFRKIVDYIIKKNFEQSKNLIESIPILPNIDHAQKALLCSSLYKKVSKEDNLLLEKVILLIVYIL